MNRTMQEYYEWFKIGVQVMSVLNVAWFGFLGFAWITGIFDDNSADHTP